PPRAAADARPVARDAGRREPSHTAIRPAYPTRSHKASVETGRAGLIGSVLPAEKSNPGWPESAVLRNPGAADSLSMSGLRAGPIPRGCGVPQTPATRNPHPT